MRVERVGAGVHAGPRVRPWLIAATAAVGWAAFTMVILHIVSAHDPVTDTISSYAFSEQGDGLLGASVLSLAVGSLILLGALGSARVNVRGTPAILMSSWSAGLALAAVFPASFADHPDPVSGKIHQWSCVVAFLSLPGVAFAIVERLRANPALARTRRMLLGVAWVSTISLAVFGLSYLLGKFPDSAVLEPLADALPVGFAQRIALLADLLLLGTMLVLARRATRAPGHA